MGYDPFISVQSAWRLSRGVHRADSLDDLLSQSDYVSIHIPLMDNTKGFINKEVISKMKKGARLLNFSRGQLVNDDDLLEAIESGHISKYVTDFPNDKLLGVENIVAIPHLGASTRNLKRTVPIWQLPNFAITWNMGISQFSELSGMRAGSVPIQYRG